MNISITPTSSFAINILDPHTIALPNVFGDEPAITYLAGTVQIAVDGQPVGEWYDESVFDALRDLAQRTSFHAGVYGHIDIFYTPDEFVHFALRPIDQRHPAVTITTTDHAYGDAITCAEVAVGEWCASYLDPRVWFALRD